MGLATSDQLNVLISAVTKGLGRLSTDNRIAIADAALFTYPAGFFLYVGTAGDVTYTDMAGRTATRPFTAGYHPSRFTAVQGAAGTNLEALF